jgi:peroxiredoxin
MTSHLVRWHEQFAREGLVVLEIDDGTVDRLPAVEEWARRERIPYPVLHDANGAASRLYGVAMYPVQYLIGRDGKVVWEDHGWADERPAQAEEAIRRALAQGS